MFNEKVITELKVYKLRLKKGSKWTIDARPVGIQNVKYGRYAEKADALKAMIVLHRPLDFRFSRHLWHHFCSIVSIQSYKFREVALRISHIVSFILIGTLSVLHLMFQIYQVCSALGALANFHAVLFCPINIST